MNGMGFNNIKWNIYFLVISTAFPIFNFSDQLFCNFLNQGVPKKVAIQKPKKEVLNIFDHFCFDWSHAKITPTPWNHHRSFWLRNQNCDEKSDKQNDSLTIDILYTIHVDHQCTRELWISPDRDFDLHKVQFVKGSGSVIHFDEAANTCQLYLFNKGKIASWELDWNLLLNDKVQDSAQRQEQFKTFEYSSERSISILFRKIKSILFRTEINTKPKNYFTKSNGNQVNEFVPKFIKWKEFAKIKLQNKTLLNTKENNSDTIPECSSEVLEKSLNCYVAFYKKYEIILLPNYFKLVHYNCIIKSGGIFDACEPCLLSQLESDIYEFYGPENFKLLSENGVTKLADQIRLSTYIIDFKLKYNLDLKEPKLFKMAISCFKGE